MTPWIRLRTWPGAKPSRPDDQLYAVGHFQMAADLDRTNDLLPWRHRCWRTLEQFANALQRAPGYRRLLDQQQLLKVFGPIAGGTGFALGPVHQPGLDVVADSLDRQVGQPWPFVVYLCAWQ